MVTGPALPQPRTPLLGREAEVDAVRRLLLSGAGGLVTLLGPGGVGKTRLALAVAAALQAHFPDSAWFVPLAPVRDPALVPATIAHALGFAEAADRPLPDTLIGALRDRHLLLVLDNCEHLLAAATLVGDLLAACPGLTVLATSRAPLRLDMEQLYPVPPLGLLDADASASPDTVLASPATALFVRRAQTVRPNFAVTPDSAPAVAAICRRLDGLPLAIELAAARVRFLAPAALLAQLDQRLALLTGGPRDLPARHQTLRAAIDWSHGLLAAPERRLFARLGVFAGGCTPEAAAAVGAGADEPPGAALAWLEALIDQSLLQASPDAAGATRLTLLETIREYALERLEETGEGEAIRGAHAAHFLALFEEARPELHRPAQGAWLARLEAEHDNLRAALAWALEQQDAPLALRLCGAASQFWWAHGHRAEPPRWLAAALALPGAGVPTVHRAAALNYLGVHRRAQGDYAAARALLAEAVALRRAQGNPAHLAMALHNLGETARQAGDPDTAEPYLREALALRRALGVGAGVARGFALYGLAQSLNSLGRLAHHRGDPAAARAHGEESLALLAAGGDPRSVAEARLGLGLVALDTGDLPAARAHLAAALAGWAGVGDRANVIQGIEGLAGVAAAAGRDERAARLFGAAANLRAAVGQVRYPADAPAHARTLATLRARLGAAAWAAAWAAGQALDPEQAVALALAREDAEAESAPVASAPAAAALPFGLTAREVEVLRLVVQGLTNPQVADRLFVTPRTVNGHLTSVYTKLGVPGRAAAIRVALDHGLR